VTTPVGCGANSSEPARVRRVHEAVSLPDGHTQRHSTPAVVRSHLVTLSLLRGQLVGTWYSTCGDHREDFWEPPDFCRAKRTVSTWCHGDAARNWDQRFTSTAAVLLCPNPFFGPTSARASTWHSMNSRASCQSMPCGRACIIREARGGARANTGGCATRHRYAAPSCQSCTKHFLARQALCGGFNLAGRWFRVGHGLFLYIVVASVTRHCYISCLESTWHDEGRGPRSGEKCRPCV
jgi:hypothetical protein